MSTRRVAVRLFGVLAGSLLIALVLMFGRRTMRFCRLLVVIGGFLVVIITGHVQFLFSARGRAALHRGCAPV